MYFYGGLTPEGVAALRLSEAEALLKYATEAQPKETD